MNDTINNILERRSVRSYLDKPIAEQDLNIIMRCAQAAPSGMNSQACQFTVIIGKEKLSDLLVAVKNDIALSDSQMWKSAAKGPRFNFYYGAPVLIIVSSDVERYSLTPVEDASAAIENIMIAAKSLGIASCWIHTLSMVKPITTSKALLSKWGLSEEQEIYGSVALGYADVVPNAAHPIEGNKIVYA